MGGFDELFGISVEIARARVRHIVENSERPICPGTVLNMGCGMGDLTAALIEEGLATTCVGFDESSETVEAAREKTGHLRGIRFESGSAFELPFNHDSFDLVIGDAFLHKILDVTACLREVYRVLKPGGVASFNEPNAAGFALLEFLFRGTGTADKGIEKFILTIRSIRESRGDVEVPEKIKSPSKHHFTREQLIEAGKNAGFDRFSAVAAIGPSPAHWYDRVKSILDPLKPTPFIAAKFLHSAQLLDETLGEEARKSFCVHNQNYFYKDITVNDLVGGFDLAFSGTGSAGFV